MALVLADRVLETTTTAGSGTITLAGAEPGYQSFSAVGDGNQTYYTIAGDTEWEVGVGTYTASGTTLSRDTVLSSSASGSKVGLSAGIKKVFVTYPSEKSVNRDVSGNISASTGKIINLAEPTDSADAATKLYVDTLAAQGITYHTPVKYEVPNSTGNLVATYNNGTAGVSATLTNAGTLAAFVPDGVTATISDRILVYSQTNAFENGVYTVTVVGDGSTSWVLTRATDADTYALKSPNSLGAGDAFYVTSGNTGAGETYLCNTSGVITFGTTPINFVQISAAQVYSAGNGLSLTNTTFSLATPVAVSNGGTGTSATPTNGQLLIGNGSNYTLATLTAGSGVSITNSAGSITLSATGSGGTVTAVTATGPLASTGGTTPDISIANSTGTGSVVLDNGPIIYSATITGAVSASITTITGTTVTYSSGTITNLAATSITVTNTPAFVGNGTLTMNVSGTGLSGSQTFTANQSGNATFTVTSNATTTAGAANTIVARDANGYIFNNYFNSTDNSQASGVTAVMVKAGDNYLRSGTAAAIATFISGQTMNIAGNAATVTDGMYLAATQTSGGRKSFSAAQSSGSLLTATGSLGGLETVATGANAAFMSFHRSGSYASYFGLDTDNQFAVGGWSAGAALANFKCLSIGVGGAASGSTGEVRAVTISASGTVSDIAGNVRNIPSAGSTKTSPYTLATTDNGEHVTVGSGGSITVPNSTFSAGNAITIYNDTTGNVSINISLTTCYVAGTNTNRSGVTLATRGVATILFISGTYGVISGNVT